MVPGDLWSHDGREILNKVTVVSNQPRERPNFGLRRRSWILLYGPSLIEHYHQSTHARAKTRHCPYAQETFAIWLSIVRVIASEEHFLHGQGAPSTYHLLLLHFLLCLHGQFPSSLQNWASFLPVVPQAFETSQLFRSV